MKEPMTNKPRYQKYWRVVASTARRTLSVITTVLMLLLIGAVAVNRTTRAGITVGSFEIDGNLTVDHLVPPSEPIDWDSSPFPAALTTFTDGTGQTDDIFGLRSEEHTSELQSHLNLVCRLLLEKKKYDTCDASAFWTYDSHA